MSVSKFLVPDTEFLAAHQELLPWKFIFWRENLVLELRVLRTYYGISIFSTTNQQPEWLR